MGEVLLALSFVALVVTVYFIKFKNKGKSIANTFNNNNSNELYQQYMKSIYYKNTGQETNNRNHISNTINSQNITPNNNYNQSCIYNYNSSNNLPCDLDNSLNNNNINNIELKNNLFYPNITYKEANASSNNPIGSSYINYNNISGSKIKIYNNFITPIKEEQNCANNINKMNFIQSEINCQYVGENRFTSAFDYKNFSELSEVDKKADLSKCEYKNAKKYSDDSIINSATNERSTTCSALTQVSSASDKNRLFFYYHCYYYYYNFIKNIFMNLFTLIFSLKYLDFGLYKFRICYYLNSWLEERAVQPHNQANSGICAINSSNINSYENPNENTYAKTNIRQELETLNDQVSGANANYNQYIYNMTNQNPNLATEYMANELTNNNLQKENVFQHLAKRENYFHNKNFNYIDNSYSNSYALNSINVPWNNKGMIINKNPGLINPKENFIAHKPQTTIKTIDYTHNIKDLEDNELDDMFQKNEKTPDRLNSKTEAYKRSNNNFLNFKNKTPNLLDTETLCELKYTSNYHTKEKNSKLLNAAINNNYSSNSKSNNNTNHFNRASSNVHKRSVNESNKQRNIFNLITNEISGEVVEDNSCNYFMTLGSNNKHEKRDNSNSTNNNIKNNRESNSNSLANPGKYNKLMQESWSNNSKNTNIQKKNIDKVDNLLSQNFSQKEFPLSEIFNNNFGLLAASQNAEEATHVSNYYNKNKSENQINSRNPSPNHWDNCSIEFNDEEKFNDYEDDNDNNNKNNFSELLIKSKKTLDKSQENHLVQANQKQTENKNYIYNKIFGNTDEIKNRKINDINNIEPRLTITAQKDNQLVEKTPSPILKKELRNHLNSDINDFKKISNLLPSSIKNTDIHQLSINDPNNLPDSTDKNAYKDDIQISNVSLNELSKKETIDNASQHFNQLVPNIAYNDTIANNLDMNFALLKNKIQLIERGNSNDINVNNINNNSSKNNKNNPFNFCYYSSNHPSKTGGSNPSKKKDFKASKGSKNKRMTFAPNEVKEFEFDIKLPDDKRFINQILEEAESNNISPIIFKSVLKADVAANNDSIAQAQLKNKQKIYSKENGKKQQIEKYFEIISSANLHQNKSHNINFKAQKKLNEELSTKPCDISSIKENINLDNRSITK